MKKLEVPRLHIQQDESILYKIELLQEAGEEIRIDQVNWGADYPAFIPVTLSIAHDGEKLYLFYQVTGELIRAVHTQDFESVWEDSCLEFFMQREGETEYRNFECNVLGAMLAARHETRENGERLTQYISAITRFTTIHHRYENLTQVSDWNLFLEIPKQAMGFAAKESLSGQQLRGNFYKCGDKTPMPHFISWNPIDLPKPDFHVPRFFGHLTME